MIILCSSLICSLSSNENCYGMCGLYYVKEKEHLHFLGYIINRESYINVKIIITLGLNTKSRLSTRALATLLGIGAGALRGGNFTSFSAKRGILQDLFTNHSTLNIALF